MNGKLTSYEVEAVGKWSGVKVWNESEHPRGQHGQFGTGNGVSGGSTSVIFSKIKKGPDFSMEGNWHVHLSDGSMYRIFKDPESRNWYFTDVKDKSVGAWSPGNKLASVTNRDEAIQSVVKYHNDSLKGKRVA